MIKLIIIFKFNISLMDIFSKSFDNNNTEQKRSSIRGQTDPNVITIKIKRSDNKI